MTIKAMRYRRNWSWPPLVEVRIETHLRSLSLHVCSGASRLGDVKVDMFMPADIKADMFHLPLRDSSFETVLVDPPWKIENTLRPSLLWELRRVVKEGGQLILNSFWIPNIPGMELEKVLLGRPPVMWGLLSAFGFYRKIAYDRSMLEGGAIEA